MLATVDDLQFGGGGVGEPRDAVLGVGHRVHLVGRALEPQGRADDAVEAGLETVSVAEVDAGGAQAVPAVVAPIVGAVVSRVVSP